MRRQPIFLMLASLLTLSGCSFMNQDDAIAIKGIYPGDPENGQVPLFIDYLSGKEDETLYFQMAPGIIGATAEPNEAKPGYFILGITTEDGKEFDFEFYARFLISITSTYNAETNIYTITATYSDGITEVVGYILKGLKGEPGKDGKDGASAMITVDNMDDGSRLLTLTWLLGYRDIIDPETEEVIGQEPVYSDPKVFIIPKGNGVEYYVNNKDHLVITMTDGSEYTVSIPHMPSWFSGYGLPGNNVKNPVEDDYYFDLSTFNVYHYHGSAWEFVLCFRDIAQKRYTITLKLNKENAHFPDGSTEDKKYTILRGKSFADSYYDLPIPYHTGSYQFAGWWNDETKNIFSTQLTDIFTIWGDATFYAAWSN